MSATETLPTIFYFEGRNNSYFYHFIVYALGGLAHLEDGVIPKGEPNTSVLYRGATPRPIQYTLDNVRHQLPLQFPINVIIDGKNEGRHVLNEWQRDIINSFFYDKIKIIDELPADYNLISVYGEPLLTNPYSDNPIKVYGYLRNVVLSKCNFEYTGQRVFITRRNAGKLHNAVSTRYIINEDEVYAMLSQYGFGYVCLEDISFAEKVKLFNTSAYIISTHSGGLTCCIWANAATHLIELLNRGQPGFPNGHYEFICNALGIRRTKYTNIQEDGSGNSFIDVNALEQFVRDLPY